MIDNLVDRRSCQKHETPLHSLFLTSSCPYLFSGLVWSLLQFHGQNKLYDLMVYVLASPQLKANVNRGRGRFHDALRYAVVRYFLNKKLALHAK